MVLHAMLSSILTLTHVLHHMQEQQATAEVQRRRASSRPGSREDANRNLSECI